MGYTGFEILWLFFFYSFAGWVLETVFATLKQKNFANRGWINGPFCITYGIGAVVISIALQGLDGIWLFLGIMIDTTVIEWIAGHLVERLYHERIDVYRSAADAVLDNGHGYYAGLSGLEKLIRTMFSV